MIELYSESSNGKTKVWRGYTKSDSIIIEYGYLDGTIQYTSRKATPKNVGKANETTAEEQAILELESKVNKQLDKGYHYNLSDIETQSFLPMLCHDYNKHGKKIIFPCYVQPKLDGIRALWIQGKFYSRKGKVIEPLQDLADRVGDFNEYFISPSNFETLILDGELYSPELTFQENISAIKRNQDSTELISFHIYDVFNTAIPSENQLFSTRYNTILNIFSIFDNMRTTLNVKQVQTYICLDEEDLKEYHRSFINEGYEGTIIRNYDGQYLFNYRSYGVQKYKDFITEEFKIVGFTSGEGTYSNLVIWICETKNGDQFNVVPKGTFEQKEDWLLNGNQHIGKLLTVRYFEMTDGDIPRFPIGIGIRDYE